MYTQPSHQYHPRCSIYALILFEQHCFLSEWYQVFFNDTICILYVYIYISFKAPDSYTIYAVCDLLQIAMVCMQGKRERLLSKEHAACSSQSALKIFPQARSSILAEPYNMWKTAIQHLMKLSLPLMFLV